MSYIKYLQEMQLSFIEKSIRPPVYEDILYAHEYHSPRERELNQQKLDWNRLIGNNMLKNNKELQYALEIMKKIEDAGYESLLVGGFVRDLILGKESDDIDLSTNMPEEKIEQLFKTVDIGKNKQFGVNVIKYKGYTYEIAQYRADVYDSLEKGKGADKVEIVSSFKDDAARRDYTINSLGIDVRGNIVDYHGGMKDLKKKIITAVGDADMRFKEDEVRQLRGIRFASRLGFEISPETIEAMKKHAPEIKKIASERITKELKKMASQEGSKFADAILMMDKVGLLQYILPEVFEMKSFEHSKDFHPEGAFVRKILK